MGGMRACVVRILWKCPPGGRRQRGILPASVNARRGRASAPRGGAFRRWSRYRIFVRYCATEPPALPEPDAHCAHRSFAMLPAYAELHCLSNFSFLRGASHPEELIERAHALGYAALAITDECSVAGVVRAHLAARACGLKLLIGSELALADGVKLVLLAPDRASYGNLAQIVTRGRRRAAKGSYALARDDVAAHADGLLALWLPAPSPRASHGEDAAALALAGWVAATFPGRAWI